MKPEVPISDSTNCTTGFHHFVGGFVINLPCIKTDNSTLFVHDLYSLYDFKNKGVYERTVRFFDAYLKGYVVTIVVQDLESGELFKRKHRLNISSLPCDWMLTDTDFLDPTIKKDDLLDFDFITQSDG
jgi:hypothetical protein